MPVLATYFSIRRGRDPFFKFFMRTLFPRTVKEYEKKFGIKFIGWYNVAHGWDFDNVIMFDLPDYGTLDKLEADESSRALGHRAGEWMFERHHSMFLREATLFRLGVHGLMIFGRKPKVEAAPAEGVPAISQDLARRYADAAEAAGSERLLAIEHATERLSRYLREHRNVLQSAGPLILAGTADAAELVLDQEGGFTMSSTDAEGVASMDRVSISEVV